MGVENRVEETELVLVVLYILNFFEHNGLLRSCVYYNGYIES